VAGQDREVSAPGPFVRKFGAARAGRGLLDAD